MKNGSTILFFYIRYTHGTNTLTQDLTRARTFTVFSLQSHGHREEMKGLVDYSINIL